MRRALILVPLAALACALLAGAASAPKAAEPALPIASGTYTFQHRYAEHPDMPSVPLVATIDGHHIVLVNETENEVWPKGKMDEGILMWHAASKEWYIGGDESDRTAVEVGHCSGGPEVVDLERRIYWTC